MKKWILILGVFISLAFIWYFSQTPSSSSSSLPLEPLESKALQVEAPVSGEVKLDPPAKEESVKKGAPLVETLPRDYTLQMGSKSYKLNSELVAISLVRAKELGVTLHEKLGGWAIVSKADLVSPEKEVYSVLEREGSGNLGVFRGVLRAQSLDILDSTISVQECGGSVLSAHPDIKIYLFQVSGEQNPEEFRQCLDETRLFSRLEWEILDQPRLAR